MTAGPRSRTMPNLAAPPGGHSPGKPDGQHFELVPSGYHPQHVDEYVRSLLQQLRAAEERAARAVGAAARDVARAAETPQGRQLLADLIKLAADEITGQQAAAAAEGARIVADARAEAEAILARANDEGAQRVAGAREQADSVVSSARASAGQLMDEATARAQAVTDHAQRRLDALVQLHDQTLSQLRRVHEVTTGTLDMEEKRGPLADEVARATADIAAPGPAQAALEAPAK
jgi:vacuolar-type H+-ATPase subunit H